VTTATPSYHIAIKEGRWMVVYTVVTRQDDRGEGKSGGGRRKRGGGGGRWEGEKGEHLVLPVNGLPTCPYLEINKWKCEDRHSVSMIQLA
jgi:hypothetical protein